MIVIFIFSYYCKGKFPNKAEINNSYKFTTWSKGLQQGSSNLQERSVNILKTESSCVVRSMLTNGMGIYLNYCILYEFALWSTCSLSFYSSLFTLLHGSWSEQGQLRFVLELDPLLSQTSGTKDVFELTAYQSLAAGIVRESSQVILEKLLLSYSKYLKSHFGEAPCK